MPILAMKLRLPSNIEILVFVELAHIFSFGKNHLSSLRQHDFDPVLSNDHISYKMAILSMEKSLK